MQTPLLSCRQSIYILMIWGFVWQKRSFDNVTAESKEELLPLKYSARKGNHPTIFQHDRFAVHIQVYCAPMERAFALYCTYMGMHSHFPYIIRDFVSFSCVPTYTMNTNITAHFCI